MNASVRLENLTLSYDRHPAVHHMSGVFEPGSLTAVTGPNGAGKSTLLKGIAGILAPGEGRIVLQDVSMDDVAYLPQAADVQDDFPITVLQMVTTGFWKQAGGFGAIDGSLKSRAMEALAAVGLQGFANRQLGSLSAGQFQRALFARVLLQDARLILLDEPFTAIDAETTARLLEIVQRWHSEKRTIICVLHDLDQIRKYFPECLLMARECIAWCRAEEALKPDHLMSARFFREAWQPDSQICHQ